MTILPKVFTREFPLILCQVWGRAYEHFLGLQPETYPRYVLVINKGIVEAYRHPDLVVELNNYFYTLKQGNPTYVNDFVKEYRARFTHLQQQWNKDWLTLGELKTFAQELTAFWPAIYASMYIPETNGLFSNDDINQLLALRKKIDVAADDATHCILKTLEHRYPDACGLHAAIMFEDLDDVLDTVILKERAAKQCMMIDGVLISSEAFNNLQNKYDFSLETITVTKTNTVNGQTACKGVARGSVRIIMKREDIHTLQEGEILVSPMTVPDYLPAMKKAAAFVTDEGGITCHAAIVAREMKKPCVIGTKVATRILKDGDRVEVDANTGIVTVLAS